MEVKIKNVGDTELFLKLLDNQKDKKSAIISLSKGDTSKFTAKNGTVFAMLLKDKASPIEIWKGYLPANTSSPIEMSKDSSGKVKVLLQGGETSIPDISKSWFENDKIRYLAVIGVSLIAIFAIYIRNRK